LTGSVTIRRAIPAGVLTVALLPVLAGCMTSERGPSPGDAPSSSSAGTPTASPTGETMPDATGTAITMTTGGRVITATLHDNPAATALVEQLPLTLTFDDFNSVEKTARLPSPLPMQGMPEGDDPEIGDIGFWAPGGDLVLYYGDVGYWNGIARLGTFDDVEAIATRPGPFTVTIAIP
jgi:hypothetical protein